MSDKSPPLLRTPWPKLVVAWLVVAVFQLSGQSWLSADMTPTVAISCFLVLFATILMAAFGVVKEADELAHQLGEPYGTLILTLSIVAIEVILIAAVMLGPNEAPTIGRDSIFAVMMIILNLVTGICLLAGAMRYGEQEYNAPGAVSFIAMTVVLAGVALLVPNTLPAGNGTFTALQAIVISLLTVIVYGSFLALQMGRYRSHFMQPAPGRMSIRLTEPVTRQAPDHPTDGHARKKNIVHSMVLIGLMLPIVLLAHDLAIVIDYGVAQAGAPVAVGGVLIAIIVFTPESITAVKAALNNETQRAINLCLGAFVSTVGLTVPAVLTVGLVTGKTVIFGISPTETILFTLTVALTTLTYLGRRTSAAQGLLHLMLFAIFGLLLFTA
ncbi:MULTISPECIES: calcium:proton antiporter [Rhizobium/Agrobacterium group]|uniref:Calcium/proton antiporter n=1 Tax=Agrobacterium tomkonis CFBP 6623 TaxID=1183432 RepID=A0A1S7RFZ0_9HYPH|nr:MULTISPECIES: calcium:proton antiporter [Rhizobium/Agrobacterium group]KRA56438.1 calcium:proton antiporter [Rhizobium sp. Root651]CUX52000.1 Calcium/proton antiporter [Agrobacterium tomkonis CFBP 6623]